MKYDTTENYVINHRNGCKGSNLTFRDENLSFRERQSALEHLFQTGDPQSWQDPWQKVNGCKGVKVKAQSAADSSDVNVISSRRATLSNKSRDVTLISLD